MIRERMQHPGRLRTLSREEKRYRHAGPKWADVASPPSSPNGSAPSSTAVAVRSSILSAPLLAYSFSENPHVGVSPRISTAVGRSPAERQRSAASPDVIRLLIEVTTSRSLAVFAT